MNDHATKLHKVHDIEEDRVAKIARLLDEVKALDALLSLALELLRVVRKIHLNCVDNFMVGSLAVDNRCPLCCKLDASGLLGEIGGRG